MTSCFTPNDGQAVVRSISQKQASAVKCAPFDAFMAKLEELDDFSHHTCHLFPRLERFLLAAEIRACNNRILRQAIIAQKRTQKSSALFELDVELMALKHFVRKAHRLGYISLKKLGEWVRHTSEIGAMLGGWIKHADKKG